MRRNGERGQALVMAAVALGIVLIGAVGLAIDTSQLYAHRQMAQAAADAAAQAAILSVFNGTNIGANAFADNTAYSHTCGVAENITPCSYARKNGFGSTADDAVFVDVPNAAAIGLDPASLSSDDPVNLIRVTITRPVPTTFIRMLGAAATANVKASAVAAICSTNEPIPILVLHPTMPDLTSAKNGSFSINGGAGTGKFPIEILGGPQRSIQVNSASTTSLTIAGGSTVNLSAAGPSGTGGDFGSYGMTAYPGSLNLGSTGSFVPIASPIRDPFGSGSPPYVLQPTAAGLSAHETRSITIADTIRYGCPTGIACTLYSPGIYNTGIQIKNEFALFAPGLYYINGGGFTFDSGSGAAMATDSPWPIPNGFTANHGMLVLNSGNNAKDTFNFSANAGSFKDASGTALGVTLVGADPGLPYQSILFFEDRAAVAHTHTLQGGGALSLTGTIYLTNPWTSLHTDMNWYQTLSLGGNPGSTTTLIGQIIVDAMEISGDAAVKMMLSSAAAPNVRRIALVQ